MHGYSEFCMCVPSVIPIVMILYFVGCFLWPCSSGKFHWPPSWTTSIIVVLWSSVIWSEESRFYLWGAKSNYFHTSRKSKSGYRTSAWDINGCINLSNYFSSQIRTLEWVCRKWGRIKLIWNAWEIGKWIFDRCQGAQGKEKRGKVNLRGAGKLGKDWGVVKKDTREMRVVWTEGKRRETLKNKV